MGIFTNILKGNARYQRSAAADDNLQAAVEAGIVSADELRKANIDYDPRAADSLDMSARFVDRGVSDLAMTMDYLSDKAKEIAQAARDPAYVAKAARVPGAHVDAPPIDTMSREYQNRFQSNVGNPHSASGGGAVRMEEDLHHDAYVTNALAGMAALYSDIAAKFDAHEAKVADIEKAMRKLVRFMKGEGEADSDDAETSEKDDETEKEESATEKALSGKTVQMKSLSQVIGELYSGHATRNVVDQRRSVATPPNLFTMGKGGIAKARALEAALEHLDLYGTDDDKGAGWKYESLMQRKAAVAKGQLPAGVITHADKAFLQRVQDTVDNLMTA